MSQNKSHIRIQDKSWDFDNNDEHEGDIFHGNDNDNDNNANDKDDPVGGTPSTLAHHNKHVVKILDKEWDFDNVNDVNDVDNDNNIFHEDGHVNVDVMSMPYQNQAEIIVGME